MERLYFCRISQSIFHLCILFILFASRFARVLDWNATGKVERDKEMSKIVAERLLRKPEIASEPQMNTGGMAQAQANRYAQMNTYLSSLLGSTTTSQGGVSKAIGKIT